MLFSATDERTGNWMNGNEYRFDESHGLDSFQAAEQRESVTRGWEDDDGDFCCLSDISSSLSV